MPAIPYCNIVDVYCIIKKYKYSMVLLKLYIIADTQVQRPKMFSCVSVEKLRHEKIIQRHTLSKFGFPENPKSFSIFIPLNKRMINFCRKRNWTVTRKTSCLWILHFYVKLNMYHDGSKMYFRTLNPSALFLRTRLSGSRTELPVFLCEKNIKIVI